MVDRKPHFPEADQQFPLAASSVRGGCTVDNATAKVKCCPKCRTAEEARLAKHHADIKAGRGDAQAP